MFDDLDDLDDQEFTAVKKINEDCLEALGEAGLKDKVERIRRNATSGRDFDAKVWELVGEKLDPVFKPIRMTVPWHMKRNYAIRDQYSEIDEQCKQLEEFLVFGASLGPLELEKGDFVEEVPDGTEGGAAGRRGLLVGYQAECYTVAFIDSEEQGSLKPENIRKVDDVKKLQSLQETAIVHLRSPEAVAALDGLRQAHQTEEAFEAAKAEHKLVATLLDAACKAHGTTPAWLLDQVCQKRTQDEGTERRAATMEKMLKHVNTGPRDFEPGLCVEFTGLTGSEEETKLNGRMGLVRRWAEDQHAYEVRVASTGGEKIKMFKPGNIERTTDVARMHAIGKHMIATVTSKMNQRTLDGYRSKCKNAAAYDSATRDIVRDMIDSVYPQFGVTKEWQEEMVNSHSQDRRVTGLQNRCFELASFGTLGPAHLVKATCCEVFGYGQNLNGSALYVQGFDEETSLYTVSKWDEYGEALTLKSEYLKVIEDKGFADEAAAKAFAQGVIEAAKKEAGKIGSIQSTLDFGKFTAQLWPLLLWMSEGLLSDAGFRQDAVGQYQAHRALAAYEAGSDVADLYREMMAALGLNKLHFLGRVAVVTGGDTQMGGAVSALLAARGAKVLVHGSDEKKVNEVVAEITGKGGKAIPDLSDIREDGSKPIDAAVEKFGRIDIIVAGAMPRADRPFTEMGEEEFQSIIETQINGQFQLLRRACEDFSNQKYGRVVMLTTEAGQHGAYGKVNHAAASASAIGMAQTFAMEGFEDGVLVNCVSFDPDAQRSAEELQDLAAPVVYLCHESTKSTDGLFQVQDNRLMPFRWQSDEDFVRFNPAERDALESVSAQWTQEPAYKNTWYRAAPAMARGISKAPRLGRLAAGSATPFSMMEYIEGQVTQAPGPDKKLPKPSKELRFDGRVALVTGAGRGLGRAHAMLLASRGAKVIVNNRTRHRADNVVKEIKAAGGEAVADYNDMLVSGEKAVNTAIKAFGKLDIIVCNAQALIDKRLFNTSDVDFTDCVNSSLLGHFRILKEAWPHFVENKYGRVVITSSETGMFGNFGQFNYAATKSAAVAFGTTLAMEGWEDGIIVNTLSPTGETRMTNDLLPPMFQKSEQDLLKSDLPARFPVCYLCSEDVQSTGGVYWACEGQVAALRWQVDEDFVEFSKGAGALESVAEGYRLWPAYKKVSYPGADRFKDGMKAAPKGGKVASGVKNPFKI